MLEGLDSRSLKQRRPLIIGHLTDGSPFSFDRFEPSSRTTVDRWLRSVILSAQDAFRRDPWWRGALRTKL